jgi:uncharacterized repeat protein (TIGR01451 family)
MIIARHLKRVSLALPVLGSFGMMQSAFAVGTDAGVSINNRATVSYSVGSVSQTPIESSPTGNSTPGANQGANTTFVVDNKILHVVTEVSGNAASAAPGQPNIVATFTVSNDGNQSQGYALTATNVANGTATPFTSGGGPDAFDVGNLRVFVDSNGNGTYDAGTDVATTIDALAEDGDVTVFVVSDMPLTATNGQFASVQLAARAAVAGTSGATLVTQSTGADDPAVIDVVFADVGATARDGIHEASDQYAIASAALSLAKISSVISDPFNNTTNPKAIPGAVVQYSVTVTNAGASAATGVAISDPLPANTTFVQGAYASGTDVEVQVGPSGTPTRCIAESPADTNVDGCFRNPSGQLVVQAPMSIGTVNTGAANAVTVRFRVTIN